MNRLVFSSMLLIISIYCTYGQDTTTLAQYKQEYHSLKSQLAVLEKKIQSIEMANSQDDIEEIYPKYGTDVQYISHKKDKPVTKTPIGAIKKATLSNHSVSTTGTAEKKYYVVIGSSNSKDWSATMPNFIKLGYTNTKLIYSPSANWYNLVINTPYASKKEVFKAMEAVRAEGKIPGAWYTCE